MCNVMPGETSSQDKGEREREKFDPENALSALQSVSYFAAGINQTLKKSTVLFFTRVINYVSKRELLFLNNN